MPSNSSLAPLTNEWNVAWRYWHVPGVAVAIVRGDDVIYLQGHGVRSVENAAKVTPDTLFPIASCTKSFTTTAMALLVEEGQIELGRSAAKICALFPIVRPACR